jgi:hypothetical protein
VDEARPGGAARVDRSLRVLHLEGQAHQPGDSLANLNLIDQRIHLVDHASLPPVGLLRRGRLCSTYHCPILSGCASNTKSSTIQNISSQVQSLRYV